MTTVLNVCLMFLCVFGFALPNSSLLALDYTA